MSTLRLADYTREDFVLWDLPRVEKRALLAELVAGVAERLPAIDTRDLLQRLLAREEQQSTAVGGGLALPHATLPGLEKSRLFVGRASEGVDFAALDSQPVDLFFLLLSPPEAANEHLRLLARLARIMNVEEPLARMRAARTPSELFRALVAEDARHA